MTKPVFEEEDMESLLSDNDYTEHLSKRVNNKGEDYDGE